MEILKIRSVKKSFRMGSETIDVLKDIDLDLTAGTTAIITGESGSGKSTLLNIVGGIDSPDSGSVLFREVDITGMDETQLAEYRSNVIGFIFQFHFLLKDFTALENVMMPQIIKGGHFKAARERAEVLLEDVGLTHRREHYLNSLSGGERQRVAVARSLMNDPGIIVADEPTGNLDEKNSRIVENILFELVHKYNKSLLMVTHDLELAKRGDRHLTIEHGILKDYEH